MKTNPFESLCVRQAVDPVEVNKITAINVFEGRECLTVYVAEIAPDKIGAGFYYKTRDDVEKKLIPGDGAGWFMCADDAILYTLGYFRYVKRIFSEDGQYEIDNMIYQYRNIGLF